MSAKSVACVSRHLVQDFIGRFGPDEGLGSGVGNPQEFLNGPLKLAHTSVSATLNLPFGEQPKPSFDQIEPGAMGRNEMQMESRMFEQPAVDGG